MVVLPAMPIAGDVRIQHSGVDLIVQVVGALKMSLRLQRGRKCTLFSFCIFKSQNAIRFAYV